MLILETPFGRPVGLLKETERKEALEDGCWGCWGLRSDDVQKIWFRLMLISGRSNDWSWVCSWLGRKL